MIQELLSGERNISIRSEGFLQATSSSSPPCTTTTTTNNNNTPNAPSNPSDSTQQNLRCPRCDSTNTKFCYYNNYNLTQPRHFCKTCRRYWTKGGALRNVPIGGGCRKNKISTPPPKSSSAYAKLRTSLSSLSSDIGKQSFHLESGFDHDLSSNHAILWPSPPPQNSHILALLRASQNPNPNNPSPLSNGPQFSMAPSPPLWRTNQQQPSGLMTAGGEAHQNSGIQELFQRLKSSRGGGLYYGTHQPVSSSGNVISSSSNSNNIGVSFLESVPATGGEFSYLNSPFSWSDVVTPSSGVYP